ncbi:MAG: hypothetical protein HPY79_12500, partial [Bacteroidales bacterium]|nr:hypothetical protein [Bacteroidales bacterium]
MRKNLLMFIFLFSLKGFSQTPPPDSLIGTYAGQYWYANPASDPWIITNDTLYVNSIDTIYCSIYGYNNNINVYGLFQTEYYYCNHQYPNCALKFYSGDSIRIVMDNGIGPATNWIFVSKRFYGKRISHHTYTGVNPNNLNKCIITPNPATHFLTLKIENFEL